jgi:nucleoside-diphosphate-sugar epimerase
VIYVSTPQIFDLDPAKVIEPMVNGTINTLEAAARAGTQRYVLVSSSKAVAATVYDGAPHELTVDTFNSADMAKARQESEDTSFERMLSVYSAGRTAAELAFWKWLEDTEHTFVANCVVPDGNFGRVLNPDVDGIASTAGMLRKVLAGNWNGVLPQLGQSPPLLLALSCKDYANMPTNAAYVIDVQDTARLLVAAVALPAIRSERIFAYYKQATWNQLRHEVRRRWPGRSDIVGGDDLVIVGRDMSMADAPIRRAEEILKELGEDGFTSTEDMLGDFVASMYS